MYKYECTHCGNIQYNEDISLNKQRCDKCNSLAFGLRKQTWIMTYKGKTLNSNTGCSNCTIRKQCDEVSHRKDLIDVVLSYGLRGGLACLKLYTAHKPESLIVIK